MISYKQFTYIAPFINIILAMNASNSLKKKVKKKVSFLPGTKKHDGISTEKMLFCEHIRDVFQYPKKFPRGRDKIINVLFIKRDINGLKKIVEFSLNLIQRINENDCGKTSIIAGGSRMYPYTVDYQFISRIRLSIQEINRKISLISD